MWNSLPGDCHYRGNERTIAFNERIQRSELAHIVELVYYPSQNNTVVMTHEQQCETKRTLFYIMEKMG